MILENFLKTHILSKISELDKKIRFIEDLGSSNNVNTKGDAAYTILVGRRSAYADLLQLLRSVDGNKRNKD